MKVVSHRPSSTLRSQKSGTVQQLVGFQARLGRLRGCVPSKSSTRESSTRFAIFFSVLCALFWGTLPSRAQLATSFYNITGVETTVLPNAVRVTIKADGQVYFGGVQTDFINWNNTYEPKPTTSVRLRVLGARSKLPAFVNIGKYPIDSLAVSVAPADFPNAYFRWEAPQWEPHVDITVRFFTPVKIQNFAVHSFSRELFFGQTLDANEMNIELGQDGSSIVITVVPDRVDARSAKSIVRSPQSEWKRELQMESTSNGARIHALHTPLLQILNRASDVFKTPLMAAPDVAETDISLSLPNIDLPTLLRTLSNGYGLSTLPRAEGGFYFTRATYSAESNAETSNMIPLSGENELHRVVLKNISPTVARSLFPDFLLPTLRVDLEDNALLFSASPELAAKISRDLARLDTPSAQIRVEAQAWEVSSSDEANRLLQVAFFGEEKTISADTQSNAIGVRLTESAQRGLTASLQLLEAQGRAKLSAKPFVTVLSGQRGSLFLGQNRFVPALDQDGAARALNLQIGTTLGVTPRVGRGNDILLDLNPRFSTIDSIESGSRLPTLGIREATTSVRVRDGETIVVAGLEANLQFDRRGRSAILPSSRRKDNSQTSLIILVTAKKI